MLNQELNREGEEDSFVLEEMEQTLEDEEEVSGERTTTLVIDVKGAVQTPGVYEMESGSRVHDVIDEAGGLVKEADELAVNLAAPLEDGMVIYIPRKGEIKENPYVLPTEQKTTQEGTNEKININLATLEELQTLPGIGPSKASSIIAYREENGPFSKIEDLLEVSGIGEKSLDKIKEEIVVK
ncbi:helix-hairpin-helix domain-containing protein [Metabacillus niabensis]